MVFMKQHLIENLMSAMKMKHLFIHVYKKYSSSAHVLTILKNIVNKFKHLCLVGIFIVVLGQMPTMNCQMGARICRFTFCQRASLTANIFHNKDEERF